MMTQHLGEGGESVGREVEHWEAALGGGEAGGRGDVPHVRAAGAPHPRAPGAGGVHHVITVLSLHFSALDLVFVDCFHD